MQITIEMTAGIPPGWNKPSYFIGITHEELPCSNMNKCYCNACQKRNINNHNYRWNLRMLTNRFDRIGLCTPRADIQIKQITEDFLQPTGHNAKTETRFVGWYNYNFVDECPHACHGWQFQYIYKVITLLHILLSSEWEVVWAKVGLVIGTLWVRIRYPSLTTSQVT
jgi:hypothetical protein